MGSTIEIDTMARDGKFKAYRAEPVTAPKAAIVVIQEIFGVNPGTCGLSRVILRLLQTCSGGSRRASS
jgi:dienelactone hydrolase